MVKMRNKWHTMIVLFSIMLPIHIAKSNVPADADGKDDSDVIVERIKESLSAAGLVSVEQHTGHLLYNPNLNRLHSMALKQKFLMPGIMVNQKNGLKLVSEVPFGCFIIGSGELASDNYKGYRQHETLQYIRNVKEFPVSRALICEPAGKSASREWQNNLALDIDAEPFIFEEHVSINGERFYYFVNIDGSFEMYF